jgi:hypothetical protein
MIGLRLLRVALGPSFLDPLEDEADAQKAAQANKDKGNRLRDAETQMLNYIGLGANPHGEFKYVGGESSEIAESQSLGLTGNPKLGPMLLTGAFHVSHVLLVWNMTRVRSQLQVYRAVDYWSTYSKIRAGSPRGYIGLGYVFGYDFVRQAVRSLSRLAFGYGSHFVYNWLEEILTWLTAYPLLEKAVTYMLDAGPGPRLAQMYTLPYFVANWKMVIMFGFWRLVDRITHGFILSRLRRAVGTPSSYYSSQFVHSYFLSILSSSLCELGTIPVTTAVYHMIATKYHVARPRGANILLLLQAVTVEWLSTWSLVELHQMIMYFFYYR